MSKRILVIIFILIGKVSYGQNSISFGGGINILKSKIESVQMADGDASKVLVPMAANFSIGFNHYLKNGNYYLGMLASSQSFSGKIEYSTTGSGPFRYSNKFGSVIMLGPTFGIRKELGKKFYYRGELDLLLYSCRYTTNTTNIETKVWNRFPNSFVYGYKHEFSYNSGLNLFAGLKFGIEYGLDKNNRFTIGYLLGWGRSLYKNYDQVIRLKLDGRDSENIVRISNSGESFLMQINLNFNL